MHACVCGVCVRHTHACMHVYVCVQVCQRTWGNAKGGGNICHIDVLTKKDKCEQRHQAVCVCVSGDMGDGDGGETYDI